MFVGSSVASFIPDYPDQTSDALQMVVATRREFAETAARVGEPLPERGRVLAHQLLFARVMRLYPRQLLLSDPGTGKTISFETYTEYLRRAGTCRHAYILEKGKQALKDAKLELIQKVIPPGELARRPGQRGRPAPATAAADWREISNFYTFNTYSKFANEVSRMTDAAIVQQFSGCAFVCDEAHNLSASKKTSKRYPWVEKVLRLAGRTYVVLATATPMVNSPRELAPLMNLILPPERAFPPNYDFGAAGAEEDVAKRCENFVSYVRSELNLARTQFVGEEFCVVSGASARTGDRCTARGVARRGTPGAALRPSEDDDERPVTEQKLIVKTAVIGDIQRASYATTVETVPLAASVLGAEFDAFETEDEISNSVYNRTIQAGLFVFPDGSFGGQIPGISVQTEPSERFGAAKYLAQIPPARVGQVGAAVFEFNPTVDAEFRAWSEAGGAPSFKAWIGGAGRPAGTPVTHNLARLSAKFAAIIDIELQHASGDGTSFVYSEIKNGGGAVLLGLCMEQFGFARFLPFSHGGRGAAQVDLAGIPRRPRYALMLPDPDITEAAMTETLRVFNSPENADGSIVKILIGSRVSRESITIKHALRAHELTPPWTRSAEIQALGRVTRAGSHDALIALQLAKSLARGLSREQATEESRVTVLLFRHATVIPQISLAEATRISDLVRTARGGLSIGAHRLQREMQSIDLYIHRVSAGKDFQVRRIMRGLKRGAIDCIANYNRNVTAPLARGTIANFTADCDYAKCEYRCVGARTKTPTGDPNETYEIMFASPQQAARARELLFDALSKQPVLRISDASKVSTEPVFVVRDMLRSAGTHSQYSDPLQRSAYLVQTRAGEVFVTPELDLAVTAAAFGEGADPWLADYARAPILSIRREFKDAVQLSIGGRDGVVLARAARISADAVRVAAKRVASYSALVGAFERGFVAARSSAKPLTAVNAYRGLLAEFAPYLSETTVGRLRETLGAEEDPFVGLPDDSAVYVSTALVDEERAIRGEYSATARKGEAGSFRVPSAKYLRIYIPNERSGGWRYALDPGEIYAFEARRIADAKGGRPRASKAESGSTEPDAPFYGTLQTRDNTFRIVDRSAREKSWGRNCTTLKMAYLVSLVLQVTPDATAREILERIGRRVGPREPDAPYFASVSRAVDPAAADGMLAELTPQARLALADRPAETAVQISRIKREDLCAYLRATFAARGLVVEV